MSRRPRLVHLGNVLVDVVAAVPALPTRGADVLATSLGATVGGGFNLMSAAARQGVPVDYAETDLYDPAGRYGDVRWFPIAVVAVCTVLGWGLVTNSAAGWLGWQGYLLEAFGLGGKDGAWAYANLGVLVAFLVGLLGTLLLRRSAVRAQEQLPA